MTGVFANPNINEAGTGLLYGNPEQVLIQLKAVLVVSAYSAVATFIIYKVISIFLVQVEFQKKLNQKVWIWHTTVRRDLI